MIISINYNDGGNPLNYKSVSLKTRLNEHVFQSGDFIKDWYFAVKTVITSENNDYVSHSSSVNHFIMDDAPYDSAYLHIKDGVTINKRIR